MLLSRARSIRTAGTGHSTWICTWPLANRRQCGPQTGQALSSIRAAVKHAVAHVKTWRMLSEEGKCFRLPLVSCALNSFKIFGE